MNLKLMYKHINKIIDVPLELQIIICSFLSTKYMLKLSTTCKYLYYKLLNDSENMKQHIFKLRTDIQNIEIFEKLPYKVYNLNFRMLYLLYYFDYNYLYLNY